MGAADVASLQRTADALRHCLEMEPAGKTFQILTVDDLARLPRPDWLFKRLLPRRGIACLYGPSGSGKSFVLLDLSAAGVGGGEWFGHKTEGGQRWVIVALEGQAGFQTRVQAWERHHECPFPAGVRFVFDPLTLMQPGDVQALSAAIEAAGGADVVAIDTLNRAAPEADENTSADMGRILEGARQLQAATGGLVLLVHHRGKNATAGMRGHSSLFAAMDAVIEVDRTDDRREIRIAKSKDAEDGAVYPFGLQVIELDEDEDGEPVTSCVVVRHEADGDVSPRPKLPTGGNQRIVLDALRPLFTQSRHFGRASAPPMRPCLPLDEAIDATQGRLTVEAKRRRERAREAITGLVARGVLGLDEGWLWLV